MVPLALWVATIADLRQNLRSAPSRAERFCERCNQRDCTVPGLIAVQQDTSSRITRVHGPDLLLQDLQHHALRDDVQGQADGDTGDGGEPAPPSLNPKP